MAFLNRTVDSVKKTPPAFRMIRDCGHFGTIHSTIKIRPHQIQRADAVGMGDVMITTRPQGHVTSKITRWLAPVVACWRFAESGRSWSFAPPWTDPGQTEESQTDPS